MQHKRPKSDIREDDGDEGKDGRRAGDDRAGRSGHDRTGAGAGANGTGGFGESANPGERRNTRALVAPCPRRPDRRADDAGGEARAGPRPVPADGGGQDAERTHPLRRPYRRHPAPRRAAGARKRRVARRRQSGGAAQGRRRYRATLQPRHGGELRSRDRTGGRRDDRIGGARQALQCAAGRWRQFDARSVERSQLRISGRGSAARGHAGRRAYRRGPVEQHRLDDQAFRAQLAGNRPHGGRCADRRGGAAHERSARLPDRDRKGASRIGHVRVQ